MEKVQREWFPSRAVSAGFCLILGAAALVAASTVSETEWTAYGRDPGGARYSPLTQINRENVSRLQVAWIYHTGALQPLSLGNSKAAFEATPLLVDGTLYLSTPFDQVMALDPETGRERWKYDPKVDRDDNYSEVTSRGVSTWIDPKLPATNSCRRRIFVGTIDARLIALDAATGKLCADFGAGGQVDLTQGIGLKSIGDYQVTSPPAVVGNLVITGSSIGDNRRVDSERGTVRAFDARTGQLRWSWDPLPAKEPTGAANAWPVISADPERDLVFVPTGSPSPDFYGGEREGANLYANSVVALHASTGKIAWYFQVVHHDLWDYDIPAEPVLVTFHHMGQEIPAVAVTTKMGNLFVLDRENGRPLIPVEERPVPKSTVKGEQPWATQPFPSNPPLVPQRLTPDDAWGITDQDRQWCREKLQSLDWEGMFTPPSLRGALAFPGNVGGVNWGGAAYDQQHGILFAATNRIAAMFQLIPREQYVQEILDLRSGHPHRSGDGEYGRQRGTPYGLWRQFLRSPSGLPCNPPPWGALTAIDLSTGAIKWEVPLGATPVPAGNGQTRQIPGSLLLGGPMATAGGLVFISATIADNSLRAFDAETGKELWSAALPAGGQATPMTYSWHGKQYVVIAAGGHGKTNNKQGDSVVAFALP